MNEQIPKIIHQIWTQGCDNIPEKYKKYIEGWKSIKGYQYMCWSDESIKELLMKYDKSLIPIYDYFELPQQRSDFGRYLLLYLYGGFYLDIDIEKGDMSLDTLLDKNIITGIGMHGITQSFMGSVPYHPLFKDLIDHIRKSYERSWYEIIDVIYVNRTSGGKVYKSVVENYDVYKIPSENTPQCNSFEENCSNKNEKYSNAYTITHYDNTWNLFLLCQHFVSFYRYVMLFTLVFLLYVGFGNCSTYGMSTLCSIRNVIVFLVVLTMIYFILSFLMEGKMCRSSLLYFVLLIICYYSLSKKCSMCKIHKSSLPF
jgi:mannosyltransferase OCH1-like enzyme